MVTSPSSVSACDCDLDQNQDTHFSEGEVDDVLLLFNDNEDDLSKPDKETVVDNTSSKTETVDLAAELDSVDGTEGNIPDVDEELETMRKQGAIPKHFHKPLPPVPETSHSNKDGKLL